MAFLASEEARYVTGYSGIGSWFSFTDNGLSIPQAVWCQKCKPELRRTV